VTPEHHAGRNPHSRREIAPPHARGTPPVIWSAAIVFVCLALGGVLKGATGAGAPVLAVPVLAMLFDVQFAVAVMLVPNLLTNVWQAWHYRKHVRSRRLVASFAAAGAVGVVAGTVALATLPQAALSLIVACAVAGYILFRLARADWTLSLAAAQRLSVPVGLAAGVLQGASGISAPVSISFLNAMRLERPVFIATVSIFFTAMSVLQIPMAGALGILTPPRLLVGATAILPLVAFMPVGAVVARRFSREVFDRVILALLAGLALKLAFDAIA
jgi:uncharacterized protein